MSRTTLAVVCLVVLAIASSAMACRYTVRELGFVNLQGRPWTLVEVTTSEDTTLIAPSDANLGVATINPTVDPNHPAVLATQGRDGVVLMSPDGRALQIEGADPLSQSITSPLRERIANEALDTFAFVLVLTGEDEIENQRAQSLARSAHTRLNALAPHLPRPVSTPLTVIELSPEQREKEKVLLWSLGLDQNQGAQLAVIYGRGRRAGEPLRGDFSETEFTTQLALVGESCECETDRAWLLEPTAPMRWPEPIAHRAAGSLGFDPASPMVQAEVSRILSRGQYGTGRGTAGDGRRPKDLAEIVFGYSEHTLDDRIGESGRSLPAATATVTEESISSPKVELRRDDGWGFQPPTVTPTATQEDSSSFVPLIFGVLGVASMSLIAAVIILRR